MNFLSLDEIEKFLETKPDTAMFPIIANILLENDQVEKAEHICRTGLTSYSNESDGYYILANILLKKGNLIEAVKQLQNAIKYSPGHIKAHQLLLLIGKENLSLAEIDKSHQVIQNFENFIYPTSELSNPYFNDDLLSQLTDSIENEEEPFINEEKVGTKEEFIKEEPIFHENIIPRASNIKEDELDLSDFEMSDAIETPSQTPDDTSFSLDITEDTLQSDINDTDFPEINFETNFIESQDKEEEVVEDNQFIPSIVQDEIDEDNDIFQASSESNAPTLSDEFNLDINLNTNENVDSEQPSKDQASFSSFIDHSIDNEIGELDLGFDENSNEPVNDDQQLTDNTNENHSFESKLSIKPVPESFDTSILDEIENHEDEDEEDEDKTEHIPDFKSTKKNNLDEKVIAEDKDKVNLNIPIPTLTFVEVLQNQKLYDQALEILDLLEKRSSDKEKIIRKKEEIIKLKSLDNF